MTEYSHDVRYLTYALTMTLHLPASDRLKPRAERELLDGLACQLNREKALGRSSNSVRERAAN